MSTFSFKMKATPAILRDSLLEQAIPILGLAVVMALTWYSGTHGIYLFDTGINYHMGWLISNGWLPYRDFTLPLTPLCGVLTALGFKVFGVNYLSSVIVAVVLAAIGYVVTWRCLRDILPPVVAVLMALTVVGGTVPVIGTLYYNHLAQLFVVVLVAQLLRVIALAETTSLDKHGRRMSWAYLTSAALVFTKLHVGGLYGLAAILVDTWVVAVVHRQGIGRIAHSLCFRLMPCGVLAVCFLAWLRFNVLEVVENLFHTAPLTIYKASLISSFQGVVSISDMPHFTPLFAGLAVAILTYGLWRAGYLETQERALLMFSLGIIAIQELLTVLTPETVSLGSGVTMLALIAAGLALARLTRTAESRRLWRAVGLAALLPAIFLHLSFFGLSVRSMTRKSWDEGTHSFPPPHRGLLTTDARIPFFRKISMRHSQVAAFDYCFEIVRQNPTRKIFFGPELEMFYAVTDQLPPRKWPLWLHPGVSVRPDSYPRLAAQFASAPPDIVVLSLGRGVMGASPLQEILDADYEVVKNGTPEHWVTVLKRKHVSISLPPLS